MSTAGDPDKPRHPATTLPTALCVGTHSHVVGGNPLEVDYCNPTVEEKSGRRVGSRPDPEAPPPPLTARPAAAPDAPRPHNPSDETSSTRSDARREDLKGVGRFLDESIHPPREPDSTPSSSLSLPSLHL